MYRLAIKKLFRWKKTGWKNVADERIWRESI